LLQVVTCLQLEESAVAAGLWSEVASSLFLACVEWLHLATVTVVLFMGELPRWCYALAAVP
jgi:hypothetical protein